MELTGMLRARTTGVSIDEVAEYFEVSRRTAERMLGTLRDRFPEVEPEMRDGHKYWSIPRSGRLTAIEFPEQVAILNRRVAELEANALDSDTVADPLERIAEEVLGCSSVGVFVLDSNFQVIWVNRAIQTYFGFDGVDVIGGDKRKLIHDKISRIFEKPEEFERRVFATYDDNTYIENFECHVLPNTTRRERWLEHWSQPIESGPFAGGRIEHYVDITPRFEFCNRCEFPRALNRVFEDLEAIDVIARTTLTGAEGADAGLERVSRIARRIRRTAATTQRDPGADLPDSDRSSG
jgi:PAS domain-containing protein